MAVITGTNANDNLNGTSGSDTINSLLGKDVVDGLEGADTLIVDYSATPVDPFAGATPANVPSVIASNGGSFSGAVKTVDGANTTTFSNIENLQAKLDFWHNSFVLDGSALALGATIALDGGAGTDTLDADFSALAGISLDFSSGAATAGFGTIANFEIYRLRLGAGADNVTGGAGNDILAGGAGADTLDGGAGADILYSGTLSPAWQNPFFGNNPNYTPPVLDTGSEADILRGGSGYDIIYAGFGDTIDGGADRGDLLISLQGSPTGLIVDFRALANGGTLTVGGGLISNINGVMWIEGSEYDDTLTGSDTYGYQNGAYAPIFGRGGNDHLIAGSTTGNLYGGDGNDVIDSAYTNGYNYGEAGDDVINSQGALSQSFGGDGNDTLNVSGSGHGGTGDDIINFNYSDYTPVGNGGDGNDQLNGSAAASRLAGEAGADLLYGNDGNDWLYSAGPTGGLSAGFFPNDVLDGEADSGTEHDQLFGGAGNDRMSIGYGDDADGGTGTNRLALSLLGASAGVVVDTANIITGGSYALGGGTIQNFQSVDIIWGSNFGDTITFANQASGITVYGEGGADTINATSAADNIHGGAGADIINAGGGDDNIYVDEAGDAAPGEQINGGSGNDTLRTGFLVEVDLSGATLTGIETIITGVPATVSTTTLSTVTSLSGSFRFANGGVVSIGATNGIGSVFFSLSDAGNQIDLTNFQPSGFLQVYGGAGDDVVTGSLNGGGDYFGGGGNDVLTGGNASNSLYGNEGNDRLDGRGGADQMTGGTGDDVYILDNVGDSVFEAGGEGNDTIESSVTINSSNSLNVETLKLTGSAASNIFGDGNANTLIGNSGNNTLNGGGGADAMTGGAGNDTYFVDNAGDTVSELAGEGIDEVRTSLASYSLLGTEIENLRSSTNVAHDFRGSAANNVLTGGTANDLLRLQDGGSDSAFGGAGNDVLYFGSAFGAGDVADGGDGRDAIVLQGDYILTFGETSLVGLESVSLQSGANATFGDTANNFYDFDITMADGNVAAGQQLIVNAQSLRAGEDFTFNGSAEHDGKFLVYGGHGVDHLTGGDGVDVFFFEGDRWGAGDKVDGGAGRDAVVISAGDGLTHIEFAADALINIESISVNNHFATDPSQHPSYELVLNNGNVTAGGTLIVNGSSLPGGQVVKIDGSAVHDGNLILFGGGGHDTLTAGSGADLIVGGAGADGLTGGAGADVFRYDSASDSAVGLSDLIGDFAPGLDKIDLSRIDANTGLAGDQAFTWIGESALSNAAGELRTYQSGGYQWVEGDTNGDGHADFAIALTPPPAPLLQGDFIL
jgi:Ca2+-binding RTX toxin-like protein